VHHSYGCSVVDSFSISALIPFALPSVAATAVVVIVVVVMIVVVFVAAVIATIGVVLASNVVAVGLFVRSEQVVITNGDP
jgi:hypothetical protein